MALSAAVAVPALALPVTAEPVYTVERGNTVRILPTAKQHKAGRHKAKVHVVKRGETLSSIAKKAKLPSWRPIWDVNAMLKDPNLIQPGWRLKVPAKGQHTRHRKLPSGARPNVVLERRGLSVRRTAAPRRVTVAGGTVWDRLANCESGGNWSTNTGNGFSGGLQFSPGTWRANGGSGSASGASRAEQIAVARRVLASQGWGAWPACSSRLGLR